MAEKVHAPSFSGNNIDTVSARQRFGADTGKSKGFGMWGGFAGPVKLNNNVDQGVNKPTNKGFDNFSTDRFRSGFEGTGFGGKATEKSESQSTNAAFGPALIWKNEPEFGTMGNKQEDAVQKEPSKAFDNVSVPSKSMNSFPGSSFGSINAGFGTLPNALKTEHPVARNNGQQFGAPHPGFDIPTNKTSLIGFGSGGNGSTTGFGTANTGGVSGTQSNRHEAQQQKAGSDDGLAGSSFGGTQSTLGERQQKDLITRSNATSAIGFGSATFGTFALNRQSQPNNLSTRRSTFFGNGGDGFGARTSDNANASVRTGFGWQRQAVGGRSVGFGNIGGFSARSNATASNTGFGSQRHGTGQKQSNDKTRLVVDDEKSNDDMCDLPANSKVAFIPRRLTKSELYQLRITAGKRSEEMYTMKVQITTEGPPLGLKAIESFADMELVPDLRRFVEESGYTTPFPIQRWVIPIVKAKRDLMACAQTGSGKTAAYLLPILQNLLAENDLAEPGIYAYPRCLIFAPTRELTEQIYNEGRKFLEEKSPIMGAVYGGIEMVHARKELSKGPSIIVGTMGRLTHYIEQGSIILSHLRYAVIDEVDRMLNTDDFAEKIRYILSNGPPKQQRTTLMFSATFPDIIQLIAHEHLRPDSVMISIDKIGSANKCIKQEFIEISDPAKKKDLLLQLLKVDVKNYELQDGDIRKLKTLVFVNRKTFADHLGLLLSEAGLPAATIHGDRDQTQRDKALGEFKDGKKPVLIATAVAERGLDIVGVDHVINYDLPRTIEEYVHRIGRTGRVGNPGVATSFFDTNEKGDHRIAAALVSTLIDAGQEIPAFLTQLIDGIEMDVESQPRVVPKLKPIEEEEDW